MIDHHNFVIPRNISIMKSDSTVIGHLQPMNMSFAEDTEIIQALANWRQKYMQFFLTQFTATAERTQNWLKNLVLKDTSRILFLICQHGKPIGNFGVCHIGRTSAELDNLIRGEVIQEKQLIFYAEQCLCHWLFRELRLSEIYLHVFSNNHRTIALHSSIGFTITKLSKMTTEMDGDTLKFVVQDAESPSLDEIGYVKMEIMKKRFYELHPWLNE